MSAKINEPPDGLAAVDEDTRLKLLDEWSKNLMRFATSVCGRVGGDDGRGHSTVPCKDCVKGVRHVTEQWLWVLLNRAHAVKRRADAGEELPMVDLHQAYFIAAGMFDPEVAVQLPDWGSA